MMEFVDHYPWQPTDDERAALIADICAALGVAPALLSVPPPVPVAPVAPALPTPTRFRTRYGVVYCAQCDLSVAYCMCARTSAQDAGSGDAARAERDLARRIRDAQR